MSHAQKILFRIILIIIGISFHTASAATPFNGTVSGDVTLTATGSPYIIDLLDIPVGSTLTIEPGVIVKMRQISCNCYANISVQGRLVVGAPGTTTRTTFTSINDDIGEDTNGTETLPTPGDWRQIVVSDTGTLELYNTDVRYGGLAHYPYHYFNPDNVRQINSGGTVIIENSNIGLSATAAYRQSGISATSTIRNSHFHDTDKGIDIQGGTANIYGNTFADLPVAIATPFAGTIVKHKNNSGAGPIIMEGNPVGDHTFTFDGLPYYLSGFFSVPAGTSLSIDPGVVVKIGRTSYGITVYGNLSVGATSSPESVIITSSRDDSVMGDTNRDGNTLPTPGDWGGIYTAPGGVTRITNTEIRYGGSYGDRWGRNYLAPVVRNDGGEIALSYTQIKDSQDQIINAVSGTTTIANSDLSGGTFGIYATGGTTTINHSNISNNSSYGIYNVGTQVINARENYWGSPTGPRHITNLLGTGDRVSNNVDFFPWLSAPSSTTPPSDVCTVNCFSNVLFLPGIEASRLYRPDYNGGTDQLWEPSSDADAEDLFLDSDGVARRDDVYTRDVIDNAYIPVKGNIYKSFLDDLQQWKNSAHIIEDYSIAPYDWRLSLGDIIDYGNEIDGRIYYTGTLSATTTPYIIQELRHLAQTSRTGKVTIVAHSNGGLVAKALVNKLGTTTAAELIDSIVFIAVPQAGTPKAIGAILHGFDQGLLTDTFSFLLSESTARNLAQNMPAAYNLLPSANYFTYVDDPVVTFSSDPLLAPWREKYGTKIHSAELLHNFIVDQAREPLPVSDPLSNPIIGNELLLNKSETQHDNLDYWIPPEGISLFEIAGWGEKTLRSIEYYQGRKTSCATPGDIHTCTDIPSLEYRVKEVMDGDGTVVVPSALWTQEATGVKKYWVDLLSYGESDFGSTINRKHADILEVPELRTFVEHIITQNDAPLPEFISTSAPPNDNPETRLHFALHSPLSLDLYDHLGNHTGISTTTGFLEENIPGSRYRKYGELKLIEAPASTMLHLVMNGYAVGSFTLDITQETGDIIIASTTFSGIPSSTSTIVTMNFPDGTIAHASNLSVDENGDGIIDISLSPEEGEIVTLPKPHLTVTADNKTIILGFPLPSFTATISGFLGGDSTTTDVTGEAQCTTIATSTNIIDSYPIVCTQGTLASSIYDFDFAAGTLSVIYGWQGFSQPINDTVHHPEQSLSVFKGGSTIPVKFQLTNANGVAVQSSTFPLWLTPQRLSPMSATVGESTYSDPASSGVSFKWDSTNQQYIYNWSTKGVAPGYWYRVFAKLDDGMIQSVVVGIR